MLPPVCPSAPVVVTSAPAVVAHASLQTVPRVLLPMSEVHPHHVMALLVLSAAWLCWFALRPRLPTAGLDGNALLRPHSNVLNLSWRYVAEGALVTLFVMLALYGTSAMPLHEHNSYVARADCAFSGLCVRDPSGPAWSPNFFRAYFWPLRLAGNYSVARICQLSLGFSVVGILLSGSLARQLSRRAGVAPVHTELVGLSCVLLLAMNPLIIRVAVAGTPWPYVTTCLLGAALACLDALDAARQRRALTSGAAATALFLLAIDSNAALLALAPLAYLAPTLWRRGTTRWRPGPWHAGALVVVAALIAPWAYAVLRHMLGGPASVTDRLEWVLPPTLEFQVLPLGLGLVTIAGALLAVTRRRAFLPVVVAAALLQPALPGQSGPFFGTAYPVTFINVFLPIAVATPLAALGLIALVTQPKWTVVRLLVTAAFLAPLPFLGKTMEFATGSRVLERELREISAALPKLPKHRVLIVPKFNPKPQPFSAPLNTAFPQGEYHATRARLNQPTALLRPLESKNADPGGPDTLVYIGATMRSFHRSEIRDGLVGDDFARPSLQRLIRDYQLEPVHTFRMSTHQSKFVALRLAGDKTAWVELGFYRARRRVPRP